MKKATKVITCLTGLFLLALGSLQAQDSAHPAADSSRPMIAAPDSTTQPARDTTAQGSAPAGDTVALPKEIGDTVALPKENSASARDTTQKDNTTTATDNAAAAQDSSAKTQPDAAMAKDAGGNPKTDLKPAGDTTSAERPDPVRRLDTRWFISPLLKFQFQDFAFLEKNRKGYLSDANNLPFFNRGNASFAASAYKNLTGRLSFSADLGLSFGHVTNDNVLISQTRSKTYNLLNVSVYYHLLAASYRLQPYVTIGFNDLINDASYLSAPIGIGAKFNARKVMVLGQITYGYGLSKNISNTTIYSMGIYIPLNNKKHRQLDSIDNSPYNRPGKDKDDAKKKDTAKNGTVIINNYITINIDSVLKARGLDGADGADGRSARKKNNDDGDDDGSDGASGSKGGKRRKGNSLSSSMNLEDFSFNDFRMDTVDGKPVIRFVIYFEFNEYGLTGKAFGSIDKVIGHLRHNPNLSVEIKGYTDSVGTDQYNNMLSRRRAKMVLDYMNSRGIPSELMKAKAYGKDNPVADNGDPNQAWLNRRAEIIVREK